jgi:predicted ribosome quality control (RQC) complex YloA/Tae2 family protein
VIDESGSATQGEDQRESIVNQFIATRDRIREMASASKDPALMELSDQLRDDIFVNLGIKVVDGSKKAESWSFANPDDLKRELEQRAAERREKELAKLENKISLLAKEISRYEKFADPTRTERELLFQNYSQFDEEGLPVGDDISASKRKNLKKELEKFRKEKNDFEAKGGLVFLDGLSNDIANLTHKVKELSDK